MEVLYNWIVERAPYSTSCSVADRWCKKSNCPAWLSRGDNMGRCLFVPGYKKSELEDDPEDE